MRRKFDEPKDSFQFLAAWLILDELVHLLNIYYRIYYRGYTRPRFGGEGLRLNVTLQRHVFADIQFRNTKFSPTDRIL